MAYLSTQISLDQMIDSYEQKYSSRNPVMIVKALGYYEDIDRIEPFEMINSNYSWKKVKARLQAMIQRPKQTFSASPG